jgi:hypothetical protein
LLAGDDARTLAARSWFGYGRWDAPFWFIGMEPGGDDEHASYEAWFALGAGELIDCRAHHLWNREAHDIEDPKWTRWHDDSPGRRTQPTWRRLIQLLFGFENKGDAEASDLDAVYDYQKHCLGRTDPAHGETAIVELGALHAPALATRVDRISHRDERIEILAQSLLRYRPAFVVCYGYKFEQQFERVVGGAFGNEGFRWQRTTLCALVPGPTSFLKGRPTPWAAALWWIEKGRMMRAMVEARNDSLERPADALK